MGIQAKNPKLYRQAHDIIRKLYGPDAAFREGQYEAIEATMTKHRTLVVQRTGWGKSLVYFVCTKLLRLQGKGVTLVVSPLLILMKNQLEAAQKIGLSCAVLNGEVKDKESVLYSMERNELDLVLVTPETLFGQETQKHLRNISIGLFVIDEAHCISDWGHDFRLEYGNLKKIVRFLPSTVPILATTATANNRVIEDLKVQLGNDVYVSRGPLTRDSLYIQIMKKPNKIDRYAWLLENIPKLSGSGIIYCLTPRDCDDLAAFLRENKISAEAYYALRGEEGAEQNKSIEEKFSSNKIKVIVATIKLGMGYDKGDIAFIIHYQMPANIITYYQQIGRAGRNIDKAYVFLMYGEEDDDILNYFISTAFPSEIEAVSVINYLGCHNGSTLNQLYSGINIRQKRINLTLSFLKNDGYIQQNDKKYYITPKKYYYDRRHFDAVSKQKLLEKKQMKALASTNDCYSRYIVSCLDDPYAHPCGHCVNCLGYELLPSSTASDSVHRAEEFVNGHTIPIVPRKKWASTGVTKAVKIDHINEPGLSLSKYGDPGYGKLVKEGKYSKDKRFCDKLLERSVEVLSHVIQEKQISHVCYVPSLRSEIVRDFAKRLSSALGLDFLDVLRKKETAQQKQMENSNHQCANAYRAFFLVPNVRLPKNILLVDDMVDSRWTLTVCGYRLMEAGAEKVYPFALADSGNREE